MLLRTRQFSSPVKTAVSSSYATHTASSSGIIRSAFRLLPSAATSSFSSAARRASSSSSSSSRRSNSGINGYNNNNRHRLFSRLSVVNMADQPRRFAALDPKRADDGAPRLRGVVFDVDGTLCEWWFCFFFFFPHLREFWGLGCEMSLKTVGGCLDLLTRWSLFFVFSFSTTLPQV